MVFSFNVGPWNIWLDLEIFGWSLKYLAGLRYLVVRMVMHRPANGAAEPC